MKIPASIAERYVSAVERETARDAAYARLVAAQLACANARRVFEDAQNALQIAQNNVDDL